MSSLVYFALGLFVAAAPSAEGAARTQGAQASTSGVIAGSYRACSANPVLASNAKKKSVRKTKHPLPADPLPTCLEVRGEAIEIQEFLQSSSRQELWRVGENHASEDTWTFVRYLSDDDLERYAETKVLTEPVHFSSGKAAVLVRTTELNDGYVRVQISARFQGEGKTTDKVIGQPVTIWPLNSKGILEQEMLTALQTRFQHAG
jgi:hypothetical protein